MKRKHESDLKDDVLTANTLVLDHLKAVAYNLKRDITKEKGQKGSEFTFHLFLAYLLGCLFVLNSP